MVAVLYAAILQNREGQRAEEIDFHHRLPRLVIAILVVLALVLSACAPQRAAGPHVDPALVTEIAGIKAIDNHAHPVRPVAPGEPADTDYDALPVESLEPASDPVL